MKHRRRNVINRYNCYTNSSIESNLELIFLCFFKVTNCQGPTRQMCSISWTTILGLFENFGTWKTSMNVGHRRRSDNQCVDATTAIFPRTLPCIFLYNQFQDSSMKIPSISEFISHNVRLFLNLRMYSCACVVEWQWYIQHLY